MVKPSKLRQLETFAPHDETYSVGDTVTLRPPDTDTPPFIARIQGIEEMTDGEVRLQVTWFYRPEEARGGRKAFHGEKELFQSDHYDYVPSGSINEKCNVHTLRAYQNLGVVSELDYFTRFIYKAAKGEFKPDRVPVYCVCEMPFNPDLLMVECEGCEEWHHPECLRLTRKEVESMAHFVCPECTKRHLSNSSKKMRIAEEGR